MHQRDTAKYNKSRQIEGETSISEQDVESFLSLNNEDEIEQFANYLRLGNANYQEIDDNRVVCIMHIKKVSKTTAQQYISSSMLAVEMAIATTSVKIPYINSIANTVGKNSDYLSGIFVRYFPPENVIPKNNIEEEMRYVVREKSQSTKKVLNILEEIGVPNDISKGFDQVINDGISVSGLTNLITTTLRYGLTKSNIDEEAEETASDFYKNSK